MQFTDKQRSMVEVLRRKNFAPEDFFRSETAEAHGIINLPKTEVEAKEVIANLMIVADKIQKVRYLLGKSIKINSGYRCPELNKLVGSSDKSQHQIGQAVDFVCPDFGNPAAIFSKLIKDKVEVDQMLFEVTWIHLSIKKSDNRNAYGKIIKGVFTPVKG